MTTPTAAAPAVASGSTRPAGGCSARRVRLSTAGSHVSESHKDPVIESWHADAWRAGVALAQDCQIRAERRSQHAGTRNTSGSYRLRDTSPSIRRSIVATAAAAARLTAARAAQDVAAAAFNGQHHKTSQRRRTTGQTDDQQLAHGTDKGSNMRSAPGVLTTQRLHVHQSAAGIMWLWPVGRRSPPSKHAGRHTLRLWLVPLSRRTALLCAIATPAGGLHSFRR